MENGTLRPDDLVWKENAETGAPAVQMPALAPLMEEMDPESTGGAMLLGVDGVCIISHGSSSAKAVVNAVRVAHDMVSRGLVDDLRRAVSP